MGSIPSPVQWVKGPSIAAAAAQTQSLAQELQYAVGVAIKLKTKQKLILGVPIVAQWLTNPTRNHEVAALIPGPAQWVKDLELLWCRSKMRLRSRVAVALA